MKRRPNFEENATKFQRNIYSLSGGYLSLDYPLFIVLVGLDRTRASLPTGRLGLNVVPIGSTRSVFKNREGAERYVNPTSNHYPDHCGQWRQFLRRTGAMQWWF